ncbi:MAG: protein-glutamate O-methyltransferase CheR [Bacteroidetes bacterium]|nr:protein-glutamate O-methyltransferase CheR [Bacteroidota bacterium]
MSSTSVQIQKFASTITERYGIVVTREQRESLSRYVAERMTYLGYQYFDDYYSWLQFKANEIEWEQYISLITNNETYFFREPNHFRVLDTLIFDELMRTVPADRKIRIWSCGCSSGEEPYSIATLIKDKYGLAVLQKRFEVIASDLDQKILASARNAEYGKNSFRVKEHAYILSNFTETQNSRWKLNEDLAGAVKFFRFNVCEDPDKIENLAEPVDLIFFRNVSIYFTAETLKKVQHSLQSRLNLNGYLFVASCETMLHDLGQLRLMDQGGAFLFKKSLAAVAAEPFKLNTKPSAVKKEDFQQPKIESYETLLQRIRGLIDDRKPAHSEKRAVNDAIDVVNQAISQNQDQITNLALLRLQEDLFEESVRLIAHKKDKSFKDLSVEAYSLMSLSRFGEAETPIEKMKKMEEFNPVGYLFDGLNFKLQGRFDQAVVSFRRCIYLDLSFSTPHFHLGNIYQQTKKWSLAKSEYELTLKLIDKNRKQLIEFNKPDVSIDYIQYACQKILKNYNQEMNEKVN